MGNQNETLHTDCAWSSSSLGIKSVSGFSGNASRLIRGSRETIVWIRRAFKNKSG